MSTRNANTAGGSADARRGRRGWRVAAVAASVAVGALGLAACGSDDEKSSASSGGSGGAANISEQGQQLRELVGIPEGDAVAGKEIKLGAVLPLSGPGQYYGEVYTNAMKLAAEHIEEAGGPKFDIQFKDNKSGDPQAGAQVTRELGLDRVGVSLTSFSAVLGSQLPGLKQYKIFSLDGGGGAPVGLQGKPFFYGMRAVLPTDMFGGAFEWAKTGVPDAKRASFVTWEVGADQLKGYKDLWQKSMDDFGLENAGVLTAKIGATDFSNVIAKLKQQKPDIIALGVYGLDPANFMKQFVNSGLDAQVIGFEQTPDAAKLAGDAYENYVFAADNFDAKKPDNKLGEIFAETYQSEYKAEPDFYAANYYEDMMVLWLLATRIQEAGGDLNDGEAWVKALEENPTLPSLYGGEGETVGEMVVDTDKHILSKRALGVFQSVPGEPAKRLASFNVGGADYQAVE